MGQGDVRHNYHMYFYFFLAQQRPQGVKNDRMALDLSFCLGIFLFIFIMVNFLPHLTASKTTVIRMKQYSDLFSLESVINLFSSHAPGGLWNWLQTLG